MSDVRFGVVSWSNLDACARYGFCLEVGKSLETQLTVDCLCAGRLKCSKNTVHQVAFAEHGPDTSRPSAPSATDSQA